MLSWLLGGDAAPQVVMAAPPITGFDSATTLLLIVLVFLAAFVAVVVGALWLTSRVSKAKDETVHAVKSEAAEIKGFYQTTISRLVEGNALQTAKDVFQTVSGGARPIAPDK